MLSLSATSADLLGDGGPCEERISSRALSGSSSDDAPQRPAASQAPRPGPRALAAAAQQSPRQPAATSAVIGFPAELTRYTSSFAIRSARATSSRISCSSLAASSCIPAASTAATGSTSNRCPNIGSSSSVRPSSARSRLSAHSQHPGGSCLERFRCALVIQPWERDEAAATAARVAHRHERSPAHQKDARQRRSSSAFATLRFPAPETACRAPGH